MNEKATRWWIILYTLINAWRVGSIQLQIRASTRPTWYHQSGSCRQTRAPRRILLDCAAQNDFSPPFGDRSEPEKDGEAISETQSQRDDDDDEEDEGLHKTGYRRRSAAWARRYRKLIPYTDARARAMTLGISSEAEWEMEWDEISRLHGPYLPLIPDEMYGDDFVSWDDFLGVMRPYQEAKVLLRTLNLQTYEEYQRFVNDDRSRAEGLRIPAKPDIYYRDKGWVSMEDFFGTFD